MEWTECNNNNNNSGDSDIYFLKKKMLPRWYDSKRGDGLFTASGAAFIVALRKLAEEYNGGS